MPMKIQFDRKGGVTMTPVGYPGRECSRMSQQYSKNMAGDVKSVIDTQEAEEPERVQAPSERRAETV